MSNIEKIDLAYLKENNIPFTIIPNCVLQSITDITALSIWTYLTSLPPAWVIHKSQLMTRFSIGKGKLKRALKYLGDRNLLEFIKYRDTKGQFTDGLMKVKCGYEFQNTIDANNDKSMLLPRGSEIDTLDKLSTGMDELSINMVINSPTGTDIVRLDNRTARSWPTIKTNNNYKVIKERESEEPKRASRFALSDVTSDQNKAPSPPLLENPYFCIINEQNNEYYQEGDMSVTYVQEKGCLDAWEQWPVTSNTGPISFITGPSISNSKHFKNPLSQLPEGQGGYKTPKKPLDTGVVKKAIFDDYSPSSKLNNLIQAKSASSGLSSRELFTKFRNICRSNGKRSADWDAEYENFLLREKSAGFHLSSRAHEIRSTVPFYNPPTVPKAAKITQFGLQCMNEIRNKLKHAIA